MSKSKSTTTVNKSAVTGKFVSESFVKKNPSTTFKQTVTKPKPKK